MTTYNKTTLKTFFETNDVPSGNDYANLIDSQINIVETALQSMAGPLQSTELNAARVSAGNAAFTGTLTVTGQFSAKANFKAKSITVSAMTITSNVSANAGYFNSDVSVSGNISVATVSATNFYMQAGSISGPATISASGTTLGAANLLTTARITLLTAATDGTATGIGLLSNKSGLQQYVYNDTAVSANLWPCTGGQINNLASGAAFGLTSKTLYTIIHTKASGYAVK